ncbi:MAG: AraC family transcriptional regulator ligand-binding domain-containing protein [Alphaproteobacteria bacterium]
MAQDRKDGFLRVLDLGPLPDMLSRQLGPRSVERVFRAQDLPPSLLDNPLQPIPLRDFCGLHEWAVRVAGDPNFGVELATTFDVRHLGPLGTFLFSAPTLGSMIRREMRVLALHQNVGTIKLDIDGDVARYAYSSSLGSLLGKRYAGMRSLYALLSLARAYLGEKWLPSTIEVEYSKGSEGMPFESQFGVPVIYDSNAFALTFPRSYLETPNPNPRPLQQQMTVRELANSLQVRPPRTIVEAARAVLIIRLLDGDGDIEGTASKLGLGPRTLQRRLREEGTSYRNMLSSVRLERAMSLLKESTEPIETIARSLGYAATSHFTRAFTQWTGTPPSRVRRQRRQPVS